MALSDMEAHVRAVFDANSDLDAGFIQPPQPPQPPLLTDRPERRSIRGILRASLAWLFRFVGIASR
jgi:hypothetical protein